MIQINQQNKSDHHTIIRIIQSLPQKIKDQVKDIVKLIRQILQSKLDQNRMKQLFCLQSLYNMSLFIDQAGPIFQAFSKDGLAQAAPADDGRLFHRGKLPGITMEQVLKTLGKLKDYLIHHQQKDNIFILRFFFDNVYKRISAILTARINKYTQQCSFTTSCLGSQDIYLKVISLERIKIICKMVNSQYYNNQFTLAVNLLNGEVHIKNPAFYFYEQTTIKFLEQVLHLKKNRLTRCIQTFGRLLEKVITMSNQNQGNIEMKQKVKLSVDNFGKYYWSNRYINAYVYICSEAAHQEVYLQNEMKKQLQSIDKIKSNYVDFDETLTSIELYEHWNRDLTKNSQIHEVRTASFDKKMIKSRVEMPSMQKSKNPQQNGYVLNYIKTKHKLSKYPNKPLCIGGFSKIYVAEVQLWYISSTNVGSDSLNEQIEGVEPMRKRIIIKSHFHDQKNHPKDVKNRVQHEKFILSRIKNGLSIYLPKYYLLAQTESPHAKDLLSDYIQYPNLFDYCLNTKYTLSFHTKIYFIIVVVQALRYLAEYRIAHLDLKPTNIMTNRRLNLKLIDFGESYHPEVADHQPGFTMPYSAPENYKGSKSYNHKNDVFSLGVMMHQLFFKQYPFYFHNKQLQEKVYTSGDYLNHYFSCPEGNTMYGDTIVLPLIQSIIAKCLHPDPNHRPELQWIVYILRGCLDYYY